MSAAAEWEPWEALEVVLQDVGAERERQRVKWGDDSTKDHPDGTTDSERDRVQMQLAKLATDVAANEGRVTWRLILAEEVAEAFAETDPVKLRAELVQVAAVAVKWVEALDRRAGQ